MNYESKVISAKFYDEVGGIRTYYREDVYNLRLHSYGVIFQYSERDILETLIPWDKVIAVNIAVPVKDDDETKTD